MEPLAAAGLACLVAWGATGAAVRAAPALGLVDAPAGHKSHAVPVPRSGGLGLALGLAVALALAASDGGLHGTRAWLLPALGFLLLGLADDRWRLGARTKLGGQVLLALLAVGLGLTWEGRGAGAVPGAHVRCAHAR